MPVSKKILIYPLTTLFFLIAISALNGESSKKERPDVFKSETTHFTVYSYESTERAIELSYELEKIHAFYSRFFRISRLREADLSVTLFRTQEEMKSELEQNRTEVNSTKSKNDGFLLSISLPYQEKANLYLTEGDSPLHNKLFNAYVFLLFFETQFPYTDIWIKEGLTSYFSMLEYNEEKRTHEVSPNFNAMEKLQKDLEEGSVYPLGTLLQTTELPPSAKGCESFRVAAWGLIEYIFTKADKSEPERLISYIKESNNDSDRGKNEKTGYLLDRDFYEQSLNYIKGMESPSKLIELAIVQYQEDRLDEAMKTLNKASKFSDHYYIPYYTGLIQYKNKQYQEALKSFEKAKKEGLPETLSFYCEGLCYWNLKERIYAEKLLRKAAELDPKRFKDPVEKLLSGGKNG